MPYALIIGAAVGLAKNELVDKPRAAKQTELAAKTQQYSPWTHLQAQPVQQQDPIGNALQFGSAGAGLWSSIGTNQALQEYLKDNKSGISGQPSAAPTPNTGADGTPGLGGKQMTDDLGKMKTADTGSADRALASVQDNYKDGDLAGQAGSSDSDTWITKDGKEVKPGTDYNSGMAWFPDQPKPGDPGSPGFYGKGPRSTYGAGNPWGMG